MLKTQKVQKELLLQSLRSLGGFTNSNNPNDISNNNNTTNTTAVDSTLVRTIPYGIAYHNSDLSAEERELIEEAYRDHVINILFSTTTLAAGVNLPARRVILKDLYTGARKLDTKHYKQMIGRAGRAGLDECGESITLIGSHQQLQQAKSIM